ncbi:MAG: sigma-70 family RNA polymerase sigma factor [Planctomycetota bacterium]
MTNQPPALQRLLEQAPFVRLLAHALLAEQADEVVQRTWLQAMRHGGDGIDRPRSWLARIVRNIADNLRRDEHRRRRHEHAGAHDSLVPSSAELLQQEEQRRLVVAAVDRLPAPLRAVVLLRFFEGLPPRRIAARLGLPVATVWNQLRRALQLLRERLDAEHGGERRAWTVPLVPLAMGARGVPGLVPALPAAWTTTSTLALGVLAMTMKIKLGAAITVMLSLAGALAWWAMGDPIPAVPVAPGQVAKERATATAVVQRDGTAVLVEAETKSQRQAVEIPAPVAASSTGTLMVHVRHGDDKSPAVGVTMKVYRSGVDPRIEGSRQVTDATGSVRFEGVSPGRVAVASDRAELAKRVELGAGETVEIEYELAGGLNVNGIVVNAMGAPVAGAMIEVAPLARVDTDAEVLGTSGVDGRFFVRGSPTEALVGARAEGHCASPLVFVLGREGSATEIRLQLGAAAGTVLGFVFDAQGRPLAGAAVLVGAGRVSGIVARQNAAPPLPALVRSDAQGRFQATGVPPGRQPVVARAPGCAPWQGTCDVVAHLLTSMRIELTAGATIRGCVRNTAGEPVAKAAVEVGSWGDFAHYVARTGAAGLFELAGLPAGDLTLTAEHSADGKAEQRVRTEADAVVDCVLQLSRGIELQGRVVDEAGGPISGAGVHAASREWQASAGTDHDGKFVVANCPAGQLLTVAVRKRGFAELRRADVDPSRGAVDWTVNRATVRISGIVRAPDGTPLPNARVSAVVPAAAVTAAVHPSGPDGHFEIGPIAPGTWTIVVHSSAFPTFVSEPRDLAADEVWDLGTIQLVAGGTVVVSADGDRSGVTFAVVDAEARTSAWLTEQSAALVSEQLAPGNYRLLVSGTTAAQSLPFVVRAGEMTELAVKLAPGVRQQLAVHPPTTSPVPAGVSVRVHRDGVLLSRTWIALPNGQPGSGELCLAPGNYDLTIVDGQRQFGSASFSIGTSEGPPLQLTLH